MKVAFISRNTLFTGRGGDTVQIVKTADYLKQLGLSVDIYRSSEKINYAQYDVLHGFNVIRPADLITHFKNFKGVKLLSTIYVDYSEFEQQARGGLAGRLFSKMDSDRTEYLKAILRRVKNGEKSVNLAYLLKGHRNTLKQLLQLSDRLLPNSESEYRRLLQKYGIAKAYTVVPNAIDRHVFQYDADIAHKQDNLVLCAARIDGVKNQLNLVKALCNTSFELLLIGKPAPNHTHYYNQCRAEAGANITFINEMPQEHLISYYQKAKVHAMPSWFETTGLSSLEAAAMSCNLVITDKGDARDYFGDHAFYCEPGDPKSIYEAVCAAASQPGDAALREKIYSDYTWEKTAQITLQAYEQCLRAR